MTTDYRALCAELVEKVEFTWGSGTPEDVEELLTRARAALGKDEPAAPEGREPVSFTGRPTYDDLSKLCSQHGLDVDSWPLEKFDALWETVCAVLARWGNPAPQPTVDGEVAELVARLLDMQTVPTLEERRLAADLLQRLSPTQPVPVSERLPGPEDCDAEGRCWIWTKAGAIWRWQLVYLQFIDLRHGEQTHWLPAHALPLPGQEVDG